VRSISLRSRLLGTFLVPTLIFFVLAGAAGYVLARRLLEEELGRSLARVAASASALLNAERVLSLQPGDDVQQTRTWRNLTRDLEAIRQASRARRIFVVDREGRVRLDVGGPLPVGAEMPELARDRFELASVFEGGVAWSQVLFEGSDGRLYKTGYAPVRTETEVVGAVGMEATAEFFGPLRRLFQGFAALMLGALAVLGVVAAVTAESLAQPLRRLVAAAVRMGGGDLDTHVAMERTREIGTLARELESMREALASRDRQLKMMLAGVAHEVKNPIGGIELFAGLLAEELAVAGGADAKGHVDRIRHEISYLKRIVDDFLAFARERRLSIGPVDAHGVLAQAKELLESDAKHAGVTLTLDAEAGTVEGDWSLLVAAVTNVVKNAIQASKHGDTVSLRGRPNPDRYVIEVADSGAGIPEEIREQIFEPFFTTRQQGTGLGLALVKKIATAHHGTVHVTSAPGTTTFQIALPTRRGST
jgi:signal transduction histidine kinase